MPNLVPIPLRNRKCYISDITTHGIETGNLARFLIMKKYRAKWKYKEIILFNTCKYNAKIDAIVKLKIPKPYQNNFYLETLLNGMEFEDPK